MKKIKIHPWTLGIFVFFGVVITVNGLALWLAMRHQDPLVSENYYEEALHYGKPKPVTQ